jgi:hypothetical protein
MCICISMYMSVCLCVYVCVCLSVCMLALYVYICVSGGGGVRATTALVFFGLCGFWIWTDPEHRESNMIVLCGPVGGVNYSVEGLLGGSSVEEGVGQPAGVP